VKTIPLVILKIHFTVSRSEVVFFFDQSQWIVLGDVHFYGYTNDTWNPNTYPITRFLSETGLQASPSLDSWYQITQNITDLQFQSAFSRHREHSPNKLNDILYVNSTSSDDFILNNALFFFSEMKSKVTYHCQ
jgi:hypothetical protein